ncbi:MAG: lysophospholipid acyltransferase family protein [Pseudomonadota bacterium]
MFGGLGAFYVWLCFRTTRWEWIGREYLDPLLADRAFIGAVWHARISLVAMLRPPHRQAFALISGNNDGDLIARVIENTGAHAVRGSSRDPAKPDKDKGGSAALKAMVQALEDGHIVVGTPDGPRGPRMRMKPGLAKAAIVAGAPILPVAFSVRRGKMLRSWDRMLVPTPFNRGVWVFGPPIQPPRALERETIAALCAEVETAIMVATAEADRRTGQTTPDQGPPLDLLAEEGV